MPILNSDIPTEKPRERLIKHGANVLTTADLLALILRSGPKGEPVIEFSQNLLKKFGGLRQLLNAQSEDLHAVHGLGLAKVTQLLALNEIAIRTLEEPLKEYPILQQASTVKRYCIHAIGNKSEENCLLLYLNYSFKLTHSEILIKGTIDHAPIYPREIVKSALRHHAAYIVMAHNHPSGRSEPSKADIEITKKLKRALELVNVKLIDHIVCTRVEATSMAELGLIDN
ncbi:DNA repair protein RadC [Taylorella equigenitalis]|uniref:RadC family protein n=1 Tax=Taylorella equigenitalis TaxID=29575 RepID=UPI00237D0F05|nr:DNA repair protein RadC [Taylorella equigenitalis]WDU49849.1 DNA repair protein RadC [Taylorella equigenitalis]